MSRVGKQPIAIPSGVTVTVDGKTIRIKGAKGELAWTVPDCLSVAAEGAEIRVSRQDEQKQTRALHGTNRRLIANMIQGVTDGFSKILEVHGVGFRAAVQGRKLVLTLGFASPVEYEAPDGVTFAITEGNDIEVSGVDKQKVGAAAARIRSFFPPEPYKGKGIRYRDEYVRRKAGKSVA